MDLENKLQQILNTTVDNKNVFGAIACINSLSVNWISSAGNLNRDSQYFIASITKLYITSIILQLKNKGLLNLDDKISRYLPTNIMKNLHIYRGVDYSNEITIKQLMAQTSGLPDYFLQKTENENSLKEELLLGKDQFWTFENVVEKSKQMKPKFKPEENGKAFYSDTNYQLLGKTIEMVLDKSVSDSLQDMIFTPLNLKQTYLYQDSKDNNPALIYFKKNLLSIPKAMCSFGADGGIVSTAEESMIFIKAFFNGQLFPKEYINEMKIWNNIFFPLQYGVGLARFKLPRIFSAFKSYPELIGHSGLSGAFAFYCPAKEIYFTGTVNQISNPSISYKLMIKLLSAL